MNGEGIVLDCAVARHVEVGIRRKDCGNAVHGGKVPVFRKNCKQSGLSVVDAAFVYLRHGFYRNRVPTDTLSQDESSFLRSMWGRRGSSHYHPLEAHPEKTPMTKRKNRLVTMRSANNEPAFHSKNKLQLRTSVQDLHRRYARRGWRCTRDSIPRLSRR